MSQPTHPSDIGNAPDAATTHQTHKDDEMDVDGDMGVDLSPQKRAKRKLNDANGAETGHVASGASNADSMDDMQVDIPIHDDSTANHVSKKAKLHENPTIQTAELPRVHLPTGNTEFQVFIVTESESLFYGGQDSSAVQISHSVPFLPGAGGFSVGTLKQLVYQKYAIPVEQQAYLGLSPSFQELTMQHNNMTLLNALADDTSITSDFVRCGGVLFLRRIADVPNRPVAVFQAPDAPSSRSSGSRRHGGGGTR